MRDGIPVTSLPRTLLDLAEVWHPRRLERAFVTAERLRLLDFRALRRLLERSRGRRGVRALAAVLAEPLEPPDTRSELEWRFATFCRRENLPQPAFNAVVAGYEVDAVWPAEGLVVEMDSYAFHRARSAFERDRVRDVDLQLAGYRVVRITWRRLEDEPAEVAGTLRTLLIGRPGLSSPRGPRSSVDRAAAF